MESDALLIKASIWLFLWNLVVEIRVSMYISGIAAPIMTSIAADIGYQVPGGATEITSLAVGTQWYSWIVYFVLSLFS